ncbi:hypothetical protein BDP27DRAFT_1313491 [Rhodocollybia butyracea]|uniref:Uncharacterized protein n=1 Tax=Rhodocollybia butyracea TaxID=206335 RepID=A0A9P5Q938_9AGAR|nr:hypothetical protein BDP27DRAFT_1313491 [Rhodocollybia butyracea]
MASKGPSLRKNIIKSSSSSSTSTTAVDPAAAYTSAIYKQRDAIALFQGFDEYKELSKTRTWPARDLEPTAEKIKGKVLKAFQEADGKPSDGRWDNVVKLLRLSCTQGSNYRWLAPQKHIAEELEPFDRQTWGEEISDMIRRKWNPRSGPAYEEELKNRAVKEWVPTEAYPTRETAVVKQILEKKEWAASILVLVKAWFRETTLDASTEIRVITEKRKLVKLLESFLDTLTPADSIYGARVKTLEKEHWILEITNFVQRNGAPGLLRSTSDNLSFNAKESKTIALRERVANWRVSVPVGSEEEESRDGLNKTKKRTAVNPVAKRNSIESSAVKSSAAKLMVAGKRSVSRNPQGADASGDIPKDLALPSQPSFHSSQIKHSTPKDMHYTIPAPILPSSSPLSSAIPSSPSCQPRIVKTNNTAASNNNFKRPRSPSPGSRFTKQPRLEVDLENGITKPDVDSPMKVDMQNHSPGRMAPPPPPLTSSPMSSIPIATVLCTPAPDANARRKMPTLTQLLTNKKRNKSSSFILPSSSGNRANAGSSRASSSTAPPSATDEPVVPSSSPPAPCEPVSTSGTGVTEKAPCTSTSKSANLNLDQNSTDNTVKRIAPTAQETQTSVTSTTGAQHQPEYTASGYAIGIPLSVLDGFAGRGDSSGSAEPNEPTARIKNGNGNGSGKEEELKEEKMDVAKEKETKKKSRKPRGYFGLDDVDLDSSTKLKPGVVRPYADGEDDVEATVTPKQKHNNTSHPFDVSSLPEFTVNLSAFDPPQVSTQPRRSSGGSGKGANENDIPQFVEVGFGFGGLPWEDGGNNLDDDESESEVELGLGLNSDNAAAVVPSPDDIGYGSPHAIFDKSGAINVRSLEDDPTAHGLALLSTPALNSTAKNSMLKDGQEPGVEQGVDMDIDGVEDGDGDGGVFGLSYQSQMDVEGSVKIFSRTMDQEIGEDLGSST